MSMPPNLERRFKEFEDAVLDLANQLNFFSSVEVELLKMNNEHWEFHSLLERRNRAGDNPSHGLLESFQEQLEALTAKCVESNARVEALKKRFGLPREKEN